MKMHSPFCFKKLFHRLIFLCGLVLVTHLNAQDFSVRCKFTDGQSTNFDKGKQSTKRAKGLDDIVFDQIDLIKKTARMIGNAGAETVTVVEGYRSIHLLEYTNVGNLNITTVFDYEHDDRRVAFPVVHSRHIKLSSGPLPSQYLGYCRRLD